MLRHKRLQKSRSEGTRTRILNAALELFRERGFERTTMRQIASTSEMASGLTVFDTVGVKRDKGAAQSLALSESAISVTPWLLLVLVAEEEGFEPPRPFLVLRFSRPPHSTTLPLLHIDSTTLMDNLLHISVAHSPFSCNDHFTTKTHRCQRAKSSSDT